MAVELSTVIFELLNVDQKKMFKEFQERWMKKFNYKNLTFAQYFQYVRILAIKNGQIYKNRKHIFLHVYVMEMIKDLCLINSNEDIIFKENIEIMDIILREKYLEININIIVYIDPQIFNEKIKHHR